MRILKPHEIEAKIYQNILDANLSLDENIKKHIQNSAINQDEKHQKFINYILKNCEIAEKQKLPMCQDTGILEIFVKIGANVFLDFSESCYKNFQEFFDKIAEKAYSDGYFRKSVVYALSRENTKTNTPVLVHLEQTPGEKLEIYINPKGFGSENMTSLKMFNPTAEPEEIVNFIVERVKAAGANPCPPMFLGIGIGGTSEIALTLAKKAQIGILDSIVDSNDQKITNLLKNEILQKANSLNIGPFGLGGENTVLDVNINVCPTHIAGLPVAVSISCWCNRYKKITI